MKAYTDLEQSKKLAEFLPLESADHFHIIGHLHTDGPKYEVIRSRNEVVETDKYWPCWSLAALLDVLPYPHLEQNYKGKWYCRTEYADTTYLWEADNPVDTCVEMIIKLHEQNIL